MNIIPLPAEIESLDGEFLPDSRTVILTSEDNRAVGEYFASQLKPATGFSLDTEVLKEESDLAERSNYIALLGSPVRKDLGDEGYELVVEEKRVVARSFNSAGAFYACQSLRQLLPPEIESKTRVNGVEWRIPGVKITDKPRFPWRGSLLDSCRHFWSKEFVKRYIDLLALHKMNRFHWHLTEDQGWRIEIKKYPKLTEIGAWRKEKDGGRYGGFYTREDVKEIVEYAASRHVLIVPEIEMPGHSLAALACYPELSCTGGPFNVGTVGGIYQDVYCAGNDKTFEFLEDVLTEVMALFPSPWIHIGGDECPKDRWKECPKCRARIRDEGLADERELQSYFIKRIERFLTSHGRSLIGWDEILEGGLSPHATVQSWRGMEGGIAAASGGHDVIMSPTSHCYLDYSYEAISVEKSYDFEPVPPGLPPDKTGHILGVEGNMWTEATPTPARIDFQVFPRLCALAEVGWSEKERRDYGDFRLRLKVHGRRLEAIGVEFYRDPTIWPAFPQE